ncbi:hypothetical protein [Frigidibacter mobilis]|uniref:PemK-like, MazF-like toxin of type II toxin-antitoxin system n=1 Tax=Frigidibacter mobilis TaxID=1335048 RepID=A0A159Z5X3_9RHOB|nr:hypothetical protein [Frigidibacter mobilis]AMY70692.1 hypothetical protein AKL17_3468 [Frigidibacter mobilis]
MFDAPLLPLQSLCDWRDTVAIGDIVAFRFPVADEDGGDGLKNRPCLVLEVQDRGGARSALLAYGTSSYGRSNRGYEVRIRRPEALASCGLHRPTRFVGARRLWVPLASQGFVCRQIDDSAVIGHLSGAELARLNAVRARLIAEADVAAHCRAEARPARQAGARPLLRLPAPRPEAQP